MNIDWFWLTVIVLIVALCTRSALCCYFNCKYGEKKNNGDVERLTDME